MRYSLSLNNQTLKPYEIKASLNQLGYLRTLASEGVERVNITLQGETEIPPRLVDSIAELEKRGYEYTCSCSSLALVKKLIKENINAYVNWPVTDWETFNALIQMGVSDVIVDGPIAFQAARLEKCGTKVRAVANYSSSAVFTGEMTPKSFYIRPEDVEKYHAAIDIIEFKYSTKEQEETLYKIYIRGSYLLNLQTLIPELSVGVANPALNGDDFFGRRYNCRQRCLIPPEANGTANTCKYCDLIFKWYNDVENWLKTDD